jgi:hypothetical protein
MITHLEQSISDKFFALYRVAAADLARNAEKLILYQLEHACRLKRSYSSNYMYGAARVTTSTEKDTVENSPFTYIDLYNGKSVKDRYGGMERVDTYGYPMRFSISKSATGKEVYEAAWRCTCRFINPTCEFATGPSPSVPVENHPFRLVTSSQYASIVRTEIPYDDSAVVGLIGNDQVLVVCWRDAALQQNTVFLQDEFDKIEIIESGAGEPEGHTDGSNFKANITVQKCLDKFVEREQLNEAETLYCSTCKQHLAPVKKMDLWAAPDVLIIQLKRFQYVPGQYFVHR